MQPHLNSDTVNYIKENAQTIFFILFSINVSFLSGFFVMSPISFLHLVDGYFILSATSQLNIFCTFALFLWVLNLKLYSIEPKTSNIEVIQIIISEREIFAFMFLFILFFIF